MGRSCRVRDADRGRPGSSSTAMWAVQPWRSHIVPTRPDNPPIVGHTRMPLVRLVVTETTHLRAIGSDVIQGVGGANAAAAEVTATAFRDEGDPPTRHPAGIEIVPGPVGQLLEASAIHIHFENVVAASCIPMAPRRIGVVIVARVRLGIRCRRGQSAGRHTTGPAPKRIRHPVSCRADGRACTTVSARTSRTGG